MRLTVLALHCLPHAVAAQSISLVDVQNSGSWILEEATCTEVRSLFSPPGDVGDASSAISISLIHFATYLHAVSRERGVDYGDVLLEVDAFCEGNPNSHWLDFH